MHTKVNVFWIGQEVKVNGKFYARITGPANYAGTVVSLRRVEPNGIESGFCGIKGIEPNE
jgi:hypothetical protein